MYVLYVLLELFVHICAVCSIKEFYIYVLYDLVVCKMRHEGFGFHKRLQSL